MRMARIRCGARRSLRSTRRLATFAPLGFSWHQRWTARLGILVLSLRMPWPLLKPLKSNISGPRARATLSRHTARQRYSEGTPALLPFAAKAKSRCLRILGMREEPNFGFFVLADAAYLRNRGIVFFARSVCQRPENSPLQNCCAFHEWPKSSPRFRTAPSNSYAA